MDDQAHGGPAMTARTLGTWPEYVWGYWHIDGAFQFRAMARARCGCARFLGHDGWLGSN